MDLTIVCKQLKSKTVTIPPSKSLSHRAVICASLSKHACKINNLGDSVDIAASTKGINTIVKQKKEIIDCHESGSTLRFLLPIAAVSGKEFEFTGSARLMERSLSVYDEIFAQKKVKFIKKNGKITIKGPLEPGIFKIRGDISSQFITGLLFSLPLLNGDSEIIITTKLESRDYVILTIDVLKKFGIKITKTKNGFKIKGNQEYISNNYTVEGDYSQAAFFLVANYLGGKYKITGMNEKSNQGDRAIVDILKKVKNNHGKGIIVDASNIPDLVPILTLLMCFLNGKSKIINAGRLRDKESDRLDAICTELNKIGGKITQTKDGLIIQGISSLTGGIVET
jgi:3-phosphoshikimate 1-carboxyvinyltransferase